MSDGASMLAPAGPLAAGIAPIIWVLIGGATVIFIGVMLLLALSLRDRDGEAAIPTPVWVIGGGVIFPVVVLSGLLWFSIVRSAPYAQPAPRDALVIAVTGHMWWWEVRYRDPAGGPDIVLANELRLPVGRTVVVGLNSADVIHSFWVPALAGKVDTVPGRVNQLVFSASEEGVYHAPCAEYCGLAHARMALHVVAQSPADFDRWLTRQAEPAADPDSELQAGGQQAFATHGCASCHRIRGFSEAGGSGPDLTHVASRLFLGAGALRNHPGALLAWTTNVQSLKPGARMPSFDHLDPPTLRALDAYLGHLQ
jgi:cytochrome c oxidase subunit 2